MQRRSAYAWTAAIALFGGLALTTSPTLAAVNIDFDATALTDQNISVVGVETFASDTVESVSLDTDTAYNVQLPGGLLTIEITAAGTVDYAPSLDGVLSGRGTTTLALEGVTVDVDATALSQPSVQVPGVVAFSTSSVATMTVMPGDFVLLAGKARVFEVTDDGEIDFSTTFDGFFSGRGTDTLVVDGFEITIDATALDHDVIQVAGVQVFNTSSSVNLTLMPVDNYAIFGGGDTMRFDVTLDGEVDYATALDSWVSGSGTTTLTIEGHEVSLDATDLTPHTIQLSGAVVFDTDSVQSLTVIPGAFLRILYPGGEFYFEVTNDGDVDFAAGLDSFLSGDGTDTLTLTGADVSFDVTALAPSAIQIQGFVVLSSTEEEDISMIPGTYRLTGAGDNQPFTIEDDGLFADLPAEFASEDVSGEGTDTLVLGAIPPETLTADADTYLRQGHPNKNDGDEEFLRVRASGRNRALVRFDLDDVSGDVSSATLRLYIETNADNWGSSGRDVGAYAMTTDWTEDGATWKSPDDTNTSNGSQDGDSWTVGGNDSSEWPYDADATDTVTHTNGLTGWVEFDVTDDVLDYLDGTRENYGWMVRKLLQGQNGRVEYASREAAENGPELYIEFD